MLLGVSKKEKGVVALHLSLMKPSGLEAVPKCEPTSR